MNESFITGGIHDVKSIELGKRKDIWEELSPCLRGKSYTRHLTIKTTCGANIELTLFGTKDNLTIIDEEFEEGLEQYAKECENDSK